MTCQRCGGHTDDPVRDNGRWLCDACARVAAEDRGWGLYPPE